MLGIFDRIDIQLDRIEKAYVRNLLRLKREVTVTKPNPTTPKWDRTLGFTISELESKSYLDTAQISYNRMQEVFEIEAIHRVYEKLLETPKITQYIVPGRFNREIHDFALVCLQLAVPDQPLDLQIRMSPQVYEQMLALPPHIPLAVSNYLEVFKTSLETSLHFGLPNLKPFPKVHIAPTSYADCGQIIIYDREAITLDLSIPARKPVPGVLGDAVVVHYTGHMGDLSVARNNAIAHIEINGWISGDN